MKKASIGLLIFVIFCLVCGYFLYFLINNMYIDNLLKGFVFIIGYRKMLCLWGYASILCGVAFTVFNKFLINRCTFKSLGFAFGISLFSGSGLSCLIDLITTFGFASPEEYPIQTPVSLCVGFLSLIAVVILITFYIRYRRENPSCVGFITDLIVGIVYVVPFAMLSSTFYLLCSRVFHYVFPDL